MSEASLERGYRRLLAWYPPGFRAEQEDEMLAVLMAGADDDQRRPRLPDTVDVLRGALRMRLRSLRSGPENRSWADGLAVFSVLAPVFLVTLTVLQGAFPGRFPWVDTTGFRVALAGQVVLAALVLLGLRWRALRWLALVTIAGSVAYWYAARYWIPFPLQLLTSSVYLLEAAALTISPGPARGRHLVRGGHGVVLLLTAGAVQVSTMWVRGPAYLVFALHTQLSGPLLITGLVLVVAALGTAVALRMNRYLLLLLAVMLYPYLLQLGWDRGGDNESLIGNPTPRHLITLYGPPLLLAVGAIAVTLWRRPADPKVTATTDEAKPA